MYRANLNNRDKGGAIAAVVAIHAALLFALLHLSGKIDLTDPQSALMRMFDLRDRCRRLLRHRSKRSGRSPRRRRAVRRRRTSRAKRRRSSRPSRRIVTPPVQQIAASETPRQGAAPTQGASNVRGPGTGAGGVGNGTGSGSGGNGPGGGGDNGVAEPPHLVTPVLSGRDFPRDMLDQWPRGATVFLRLRVDRAGLCQRMHCRSRDRRRGDRLRRCATSPTSGFASGPRSTEADKRLQDGSDTRNQRRDRSKGNRHDRSGMVGI